MRTTVADFSKITCILRGYTAQETRSILEVLKDSGIRSVEITMNTEGALSMISEAVERFGAARVALAVELLEGEQLRGTRLYTVPPHHEDGPAAVRIEGIRFYLPGGAGPEGLTLRSDAHYIDRGDRCVLP